MSKDKTHTGKVVLSGSETGSTLIGEACLRFVPSRVEGLSGVQHVVILSDRIELHLAEGPRVFKFIDMAEWPDPAWWWRKLYHLGKRPKFLAVADRNWCRPAAERFFAFYTKPKIVIYMPTDETDDYWNSYFVYTREIIHTSGFYTYDLG